MTLPDRVHRHPSGILDLAQVPTRAVVGLVVLLFAGTLNRLAAGELDLRVSWGHRSTPVAPFHIEFAAAQLDLVAVRPLQLEPDDYFTRLSSLTHAGGGDVDGANLTLRFADLTPTPITNLHSIWAHLLQHGDSDTAARLRQDPAYRPDPRRLTVLLDSDGTRGFSVTVDQLQTHRTFWLPELDLFLNAGAPTVSLEQHLRDLASQRERRILDTAAREPEATYAEFKQRWTDMGHPAYHNPHSIGPGHIVGLSWDSALPKFGIDRGAGVWNDYGNSDRFSLVLGIGDLAQDITTAWRGQRLRDGLPIVTTLFEQHGMRWEVEQFAFPLRGPPPERRGDLNMVLLERVRLTELQGRRRTEPVSLTFRRQSSASNARLHVHTRDHAQLWTDDADGSVLLALQSPDVQFRANTTSSGTRWITNHLLLEGTLPAHGTRELLLKLPSPSVASADQAALLALDFDQARQATLRFWADQLARGAQFEVPDPAVNTLFRASLWHALRLPRRHGGSGAAVHLDLPYSNFAYDQRGSPWPINQAVYVDYMLYDLRGYHDLAEEELAALFRNNQEPDGRVGGFANWGVYTPGMLYAVAQHHLLSGDRASLERLLSPTLQALDWCLTQLRQAAATDSPARGLILAPLNDLSHDPKAWAFNQAYFFAGLDHLAHVLEDIQHPRAAECHHAARTIRQAIERSFARASVKSPIVQLRDRTWIPYVPGDALTPRRLLDVWYPTDVDTGPLHLSRLRALDPQGPLTTYLLHDHEDNLFLNGWSMANEPVYNQHATAHLLRDDAPAAIRAFYSMLACAFSHTVFEPVEHRWGWGQYFGPPSTDGAWFDLYRHMLIQERDDDTLLLGAAIPRRWFEDGKTIRVERAPTRFGPLAFRLESRAARGEIRATVDPPTRNPPAGLVVRLRHPEHRPLRTVTLNGRPWSDFDAAKEWIRIPKPGSIRQVIRATYAGE